MKLIVYTNKDECLSKLTWLESELKHLHEFKTERYTGFINHPTGTKWGIIIEFKEPYTDKLNEILTDVNLSPYTSDWTKIEII